MEYIENKSYSKKDENIVNEKIIQIHNSLEIKHGTFEDELPEQKMSVRYFSGNEKILEIGGSIGRNAMVMNYLQKEQNNIGNLVTLESNPSKISMLKENRELNNLNFHIENAALSNTQIIQKGEQTFKHNPDTNIPRGFKQINTITLAELNEKYNISFDTLVVDCEGAFFYILKESPEILNGINIIIMENDYTKVNHKEFVDKTLLENNFYIDYTEPLKGHDKYHFHFRKNFFEVWLRKQTI
jgi:FkbM family methyltransferase